MKKRKLINGAAALAGALGFYALFTSQPQVFLRPHAALLSLIPGVSFEYVEGLGYLALARNFAITPDCMGAKWFVAALLILCLSTDDAHAHERPSRAALRLGLCLFVLIALAFAVSALRIAVSIPFATHPSGALIHRLISLAAYFLSLLALYAGAQALSRRTER